MSEQFSAKDCISAFLEFMEVKSEDIGLSNNTVFKDPCGIDNHSTAKDVLRCLLRANECEELGNIWNKKSYTVKIEGKDPRELPLASTVTADDDSPLLSDRYKIIGGKTGTLTPHGAFNLAVILENPENNEHLACVVLYADEKNSKKNNRFLAAKQATDIALKKSDNKAEVCAASAIVCKIPENTNGEEYYESLDILYEKNSSEIKMPASVTKLMTAVTALEFVKDLDEKITVTEDDVLQLPSEFYSNDFKAGDIITVKDALFAMLLSSSNAAAYILARFAGNKTGCRFFSGQPVNHL